MRPRTLIAIVASLAVTAAQATTVYDYGKDEYVIISDGLAPNKRLSIAAHGAGKMGPSAASSRRAIPPSPAGSAAMARS